MGNGKMKRYRKQEGTPLFNSVGSDASEVVMPPGEYTVRVEWRVETTMKVVELESKRPYTIYLKEEGIEGDVVKGCIADLTIGLTDGVVLLHNGGTWSAKKMPEQTPLIENAAFEEVVNLFNHGHTPAIPIATHIKRREWND